LQTRKISPRRRIRKERERKLLEGQVPPGPTASLKICPDSLGARRMGASEGKLISGKVPGEESRKNGFFRVLGRVENIIKKEIRGHAPTAQPRKMAKGSSTLPSGGKKSKTLEFSHFGNRPDKQKPPKDWTALEEEKSRADRFKRTKSQ